MKPRGFTFLPSLAPDRGIDLGTSRTLICAPGEGIMVDEPTLVAVDRTSRRIFNRGQAVGNLAHLMQGRTPETVAMVRPVRNGAVADLDLCAAMLQVFMRKTVSSKWTRPRALIEASRVHPTGLGHDIRAQRPFVPGH